MIGKKSELIKKINSIFLECDVDFLYNVDMNGKLNVSPDSKFRENGFKKYINTELDALYDQYGATFYSPISDVSIDEYSYLKINGFKPDDVMTLLSKKIIDKINDFEEDKIDKIDLSKEIPMEYIFDYNVSREKEDIKQFGEERNDNFYKSYNIYEEYKSRFDNGYNTKIGFVNILDEDVIESIQELKEEYGEVEYIDKICNDLKKSVSILKFPIISKEEFIELLLKYRQDNNREIWTYGNLCYDGNVSAITRTIEKKFEAQQLLERLRKEKNILNQEKELLIEHSSNSKNQKM